MGPSNTAIKQTMEKAPASAISDFAPHLRERAAYRFWVSDQARFSDLDALGHVSAVSTNEYFNGARANLFHKAIKAWPRSKQLPVMKLSIVLHERELHFPTGLDVGLVIEKFGTTSVTVAAAVFVGDECISLSRNIFVFIDTDSRAPTIPSNEIKESLLALAGPIHTAA